MMANRSINLPPGFIFSPTDEELVFHFLFSKASLLPCLPNIIPDLLDLSFLDPWQLNGKALSSENEHYFFTKVKEHRATENGYWREIGVTYPIFSAIDNKVGIKKYLVFNVGEGPQATETNWVMQEYHICSFGFDTSCYQSTANRRQQLEQSWSNWVLCRVYENKSQKLYCHGDDNGSELSLLDEDYMCLLDDDLEEISMPK